MIWKTVHETKAHKYQQQLLTGRRRAVAKVADARAPAHAKWLAGGALNKRTPKEEATS